MPPLPPPARPTAWPTMTLTQARIAHELTQIQMFEGTFQDNFTLGKKLGAGAYSTVKVGTHKNTKTKFAVKIITKVSRP